jgi:phospholipase D3/4
MNPNNQEITAPRAYLVESIPKGLEDLRGTPGVQYTEEVLVRLTRAARSTIDLTAMYWALLPDPEGDDEKGFTEEEFEKMGAGAGRLLYEALRDAAARGVHIRILQAPGFSKDKTQPPPKQESDRLQDEFPDQISIHTMEITKWYGGSGILHQKIWIFDERPLSIGSANMDWKSISQVKKMGVAVEDCPIVAQDVGKYFEAWWTFSALPPHPIINVGMNLETVSLASFLALTLINCLFPTNFSPLSRL